jgi:hypothetical protein
VGWSTSAPRDGDRGGAGAATGDLLVSSMKLLMLREDEMKSHTVWCLGKETARVIVIDDCSCDAPSHSTALPASRLLGWGRRAEQSSRSRKPDTL